MSSRFGRLRDLLRADALDRAGGCSLHRHPGGHPVLRRPLPPHWRPRPVHVLPPPAVPQELSVTFSRGMLPSANHSASNGERCVLVC
eukprot:1495362-Pyramimonas_sp.AAC.1